LKNQTFHSREEREKKNSQGPGEATENHYLARSEFRTGRRRGNLSMTPDMAVVTPLNNPGGPEGDTVTVDEQLLNTEYFTKP
jgi:hypothetical protein